MKFLLKITLLALLGLFMIIPLKAQEENSSENLVKINLFSPLVRTGSFFYEKVVGEYSSVQLGFFYTGASFLGTRFRGIGITPEFRYYLSEARSAPSGTFVAPYVRYQSFTLSSDEANGEGSFSGFGGGLLVGYQRLLRDRISLEGFIGPSYTSGKLNVTDGDQEDFDLDFFDGFGVRFGFTAGIAF